MKVNVLVMPQAKPVQLELFELLPGVQVHAKPMNITVPTCGIIKWVPAGNGLYQPVLETHPAVVDLTKWNETVYGCSKWQVRALVEAGFVEGERIAPRRLKINLVSFMAFREKMRGNPWFWQDADNLRKYSEAMTQIQRHGRRRRHAEKTASEADSGNAPQIDSEPGLSLPAVSTPERAENASPRHGGTKGKARRPIRQTQPAARAAAASLAT